jgi:hypothetical protein
MKNSPRIIFYLTICLIITTFSCNNFSVNHEDNIGSNTKIIKNENDTDQKSDIFPYENEIFGGWLKLELDQKIVENKLGPPDFMDEDVYLGATGTFMQTWFYKSLGISLEMESENKGETKKVRNISIMSPCNYKTSKGIGIGFNEIIVKKRYKGLIDSTFSDESSIVIGTVYDGIVFSIEKGIVTKIFIGSLAE